MSLREFGRKLAAKKGLQPIQPGQTRPVGFYMVDHTTGRPLIANRNAVVVTDTSELPVVEGQGLATVADRAK
jgi:hypothetical protein